MELDNIDIIASKAFEGYIVRKDLLEQFRKAYPVPTYVIEFLLGRYCATINPKEIEEGLEVVKRQLQDRTVRPGEEEFFKSKARERGSIRLIDIITARLDTGSDSYVATLPSLRLNKVRISPDIVNVNDRMLTGGFYAEIELEYDAAIAQENSGRPFGIASIRPIQLSKRDVLDLLYKGRESFTLEEWKDFLIRSVGLEPTSLTNKAKNVLFVRMVPFVERNYNLVELGPRGTG
ncbi:MAG: BREX system Lon protease-like protein BrxL, partial [Sphaerochaetaceae bacterium]|nr:BREX system Lon protease-like protein BrxL [Sphaerochaetaceae bacterium]